MVETDTAGAKGRDEGCGRGPAGDQPVLAVRDLGTYFYLPEGVIKAVDGVDLRVKDGETIGIIGESGCGKSVTARSIMRLEPSPPAKIVSGEIMFRMVDGRVIDLAKLDFHGEEIRRVRGGEIAMVFQESMNAFSPIHTIGDQIAEAMILHDPQMTRKAAWEKSISLLDRVEIALPHQRAREYPYQMSGGMRQRAMIAMALSCNPTVLLADEPTTALDVTIQAQILELLRDVQQENGMSLVMITHSLGVVREMATYVYVMYLGKIVESGPIADVFSDPLHPYTQALIDSVPHVDHPPKTKLRAIGGSVPEPYDLPKGCSFWPRCTKATDECKVRSADLQNIADGERWVRCHLY